MLPQTPSGFFLALSYVHSDTQIHYNYVVYLHVVCIYM